MSAFLGGSAYAMVRDIAEGYIIATELTFRKFLPGDFQSFGFEADKLLREFRGTVVPAGDVEACQETAAAHAAAAASDDDRQQRPLEEVLNGAGAGAPAAPRPFWPRSSFSS